MVVIIPHITEEHKLIKYQKDLIKLLRNEGKIYYQQHPLWIFLPENFSAETKEELKKLADDILKIQFTSPEFNGTQVTLPICIEEKQINNQNQTNKSLLPLVHLYKKKDSKASDDIQTSASLSFTLPDCPISQLNIFRLAVCSKESENTYMINNSIWVKKR